MTIDMFAPYAARFAPVAIIPMHTPEEAIEQLGPIGPIRSIEKASALTGSPIGFSRATLTSKLIRIK
jgi:hypothetical protein